MAFDGQDDYVSVPDDESLDITGTLTLSAWVYRPEQASGRQQGLIGKWTDDYRSYALYLQGQRAHFALSDDGTKAGTVDLRSNSQIAKGAWTHLMATYDGSVMRLYINGVLDAEQAATLNIFAGDAPLTLAVLGPSRPGRGDYFEGLLDEMRVQGIAVSGF